ncbi:unnamed protein product [Strongylus vulgaris]|uniref:Tc1-like transposase DDE domain-containing protein n=1 Tax=Strongylus vulgaris TaxID=40348 RepID=A0A3P7LK04_STRVU|nr:unnamed protein product [Strongylus vulgaris]
MYHSLPLFYILDENSQPRTQDFQTYQHHYRFERRGEVTKLHRSRSEKTQWCLLLYLNHNSKPLGGSVLHLQHDLEYDSRFLGTFIADHIEEIKTEIERCYSCNSSATANDVCRRLQLRGITVSLSHIKRPRQRLGYTKTTTKYCHTIRDVNKAARRVDNFFGLVFTDESTVQSKDLNTENFPIFQIFALVDCSTRFRYVKKGDHFARMRSRAKHPAKVHIWGGISERGTTQLAILGGNCRINSEIYCRILEKCYIPFLQKAHNGFGRLVQDNAPAHKSLNKFEEWDIETLDWPAESPDLNPIELVRGNMKNFIQLLLISIHLSMKQRIRNHDDLKVAIVSYWKTITPETCKKYISGVRRKMKGVIEQGGRNILEGR